MNLDVSNFFIIWRFYVNKSKYQTIHSIKIFKFPWILLFPCSYNSATENVLIFTQWILFVAAFDSNIFNNRVFLWLLLNNNYFVGWSKFSYSRLPLAWDQLGYSKTQIIRVLGDIVIKNRKKTCESHLKKSNQFQICLIHASIFLYKLEFWATKYCWAS